MATEYETGLATCNACYTCEGVAYAVYDDGSLYHPFPIMVFEAEGFWDSLEDAREGGVSPDVLWEGVVSETCACFEEIDPPVLEDYYPFDPIALDECDEESLEPADSDDEIAVFSDIDPDLSDEGYLVFPWYFDSTSMTLSDARDDVSATGKVGIYYYTIEVEEEGAFLIYYTLYTHDAPTIVTWGTSVEAGYTTTLLSVDLASEEISGLAAKFGTLSCDDCTLEEALTDDVDDLIAEIASLIVESQYTFKKIKQPTVDVRLFSAFGKSQKEETQTVSVVAGSTTTTYDTY